jgi:hypothetical protein
VTSEMLRYGSNDMPVTVRAQSVVLKVSVMKEAVPLFFSLCGLCYF